MRIFSDRAALATLTKIVQGWPKLWASFRALIGIFSQSVGPSLAIWADPVQFSFLNAPCRCPQETGLLTPNGEELGGMPTAMCLVFVPVEAGGNNAAL